MKTVILMLIIGLLVVGCSNADSEMKVDISVEDAGEADRVGQVYHVVVDDTGFKPVDLEILKGDTVEWVNTQGVSMGITFENGVVDTRLPQGSVVRHTFTEKGHFNYVSAGYKDSNNDNYQQPGVLQGVVIVK